LAWPEGNWQTDCDAGAQLPDGALRMLPYCRHGDTLGTVRPNRLIQTGHAAKGASMRQRTTVNGLISAVLTRLLCAVLLMIAPFGQVLAAQAQQGGVSIVRDAEIEQLLRDYTAPILKAAGLANSGIEIIIVNDSSFNAFVTGRRMFVHTGALMMAETPNEIIGVIAHEVGHIKGGHQFRLRERLDAAKTMGLLSNLVGIGAVAAGAASGQGDLARAGSGIALGGAEIARRSVLSYQRDEERAADRTGLQLLEKTGQSGAGMLVVLERLAGGLRLNTRGLDPYQLSHPLPAERINLLRDEVLASPTFAAMDTPALQARHEMMRAKIAAYTEGANAVRRMFRDQTSMPARYGDAIVTHLTGNPAAAVKKIEALIKAQPKNPHFRELLGEALLRGNQPKRAAEAYGQAIKLSSGRASLVRMAQGRALLAAGDAEGALNILQTAIRYDDQNAQAFGTMAQAYGQLGRTGEAELATAEMHFTTGRLREAQTFALRAQSRLPQSSPEWRRAQDIISTKQ
jgi:predicted Zn-dependent protease